MSKTIYFAGSIRGGRQYVDTYYEIINLLKAYGHVCTEFVGEKVTVAVDPSGRLPSQAKKADKTIHDEDVAMLEKCDCVVAEVTQPSLGVGYEIGRAVAMNKQILCLFRPDQDKVLSGMIRGAHNGSTFTVVDYHDVSEVPAILKDFFDRLK